MNINSINPLPQNIQNILSRESITFDKEGANEMFGSFADILSDSMKTAQQADDADKFSTLQLLSGQNDDLSGLLLDMQKAELSLNLALQIRNKVIDAYTEIMRMQV